MLQVVRRAVGGVCVLVLVGALTVSSAAGSSDAPKPVPGAAGIGDRYFPLDGNGGYDVTHYDVHDTYAGRRLTGWTDVTATATSTLSSFHLDLVLTADTVTVDGTDAAFAQPRSHELVVTPATPVAAGSSFTVRVRYHGRPASVRYGGERPWLSEPDEATATSEPHMAPWWFPANDHPRDKASFDVTFRVPRGRQVIGNGELVDHTTTGPWTAWHWRMRQPMATYLAFVAAGRFRVEQGSYHGLPYYLAVSTWYDHQLQERSLRLLRQTPRMVAWLETQLGPYPFDSTGGVVTSLYRGFALENQSRPTYPYLGTGPGARATVVHELAHQWFGDSVTVRRWRDIWLNEGFASWLEWRYAETHGGENAQHRLVREYAARPAGRAFWRLRVDDPGAGRMFDGPVYQRGAMALQALRHRIGGPAFGTLLRTWASEHRGGSATVPEFEDLAARVSGQRLDGFFDAWLHARSRPARTSSNGF